MGTCMGLALVKFRRVTAVYTLLHSFWTWLPFIFCGWAHSFRGNTVSCRWRLQHEIVWIQLLFKGALSLMDLQFWYFCNFLFIHYVLADFRVHLLFKIQLLSLFSIIHDVISLSVSLCSLHLWQDLFCRIHKPFWSITLLRRTIRSVILHIWNRLSRTKAREWKLRSWTPTSVRESNG